MEKTFNIALDIAKPIDPANALNFFRGDSVVFNFTYQNDGEAFDTSSATKLRVYAKEIGANGIVTAEETPLFAAEVTTINTVSFSSSNTAGDAGNYLMAVILLDANNNVITAQAIFLNLIENGYDGIYQPGEDFRDEVLDALSQAQAAATQAQTSKSNAAASATQAQGSAQAAQASQTAAAHSATNAQASATAAAGSATQAQTSATNAQVAQAAAENAAQIAQATDAGKLALDKLPYGTLYFDKGKLSGSNFAIPNFPFSICATVRIDGWKASSDVAQSIFQCGDFGGTQLISLTFLDSTSAPRIGIQVSDPSGGSTTSSSLRCPFTYADFIGKTHTIIAVCRNLDSSGTLDWSLYLDGQSLSGEATKNLKIDALSGSVNYAVNTTNGNFSSSAASANPMMLRNLYVFNFDISAEGSPYSIADYVAGRLIPPSLIGNQFTGMYGSGWSVTGDTATTRGAIPSGFDFTFTVDVELSFSGTPKFEVYTNCQKAHAEIYDYSTQLTTQKDSASGGGFYGAASLGITASGHYRIKFDCESSLGGKGTIQMAIAPLTSGTITLSDTYYQRCNLALENYTIARNATTTLVKDASGNSNDATVQGSGTVAGDNDQSIKVFVDEIKTQINQANG